MDDEQNLQRLCKGCTEVEVDEISKDLDEWTIGTYGTVAQSVLEPCRSQGIFTLAIPQKSAQL